jgi:hypothetical protein
VAAASCLDRLEAVCRTSGHEVHEVAELLPACRDLLAQCGRAAAALGTAAAGAAADYLTSRLRACERDRELSCALAEVLFEQKQCSERLRWRRRFEALSSLCRRLLRERGLDFDRSPATAVAALIDRSAVKSSWLAVLNVTRVAALQTRNRPAAARIVGLLLACDLDEARRALYGDLAGDAEANRRALRGFDFRADPTEVIPLLVGLNDPREGLAILEDLRWRHPRRLSVCAAYAVLLQQAKEDPLRVAEAWWAAVACGPTWEWARIAAVKQTARPEAGKAAVAAWRRFLAEFPKSAIGHYWLACCLDAVGDRDEALRVLDAAIASDATHADSHRLRARLLAEPAAIEAALRDATLADPWAVEARRELAMHFEAHGEREAALAEWRWMTLLDAGDEVGHRACARLERVLGRTARAAAHERGLAEAGDPAAWLRLAGILAQEKREVDAAVALWRACAGRFPRAVPFLAGAGAFRGPLAAVGHAFGLAGAGRPAAAAAVWDGVLATTQGGEQNASLLLEAMDAHAAAASAAAAEHHRERIAHLLEQFGAVLEQWWRFDPGAATEVHGLSSLWRRRPAIKGLLIRVQRADRAGQSLGPVEQRLRAAQAAIGALRARVEAGLAPMGAGSVGTSG